MALDVAGVHSKMQSALSKLITQEDSGQTSAQITTNRTYGCLRKLNDLEVQKRIELK